MSGHRPIRSFVLRQGRISLAQIRAIEELLPVYGIPFCPGYIDLDAVFGRTGPKVLEIGFGMGDATAKIAAQQPEVDFLGVEVHGPGVGRLLRRIEALGIANLRVIQHDATEVLHEMIAPETLSGIHVFFPDPWPKTRHHKRRLIQPAFVALLASRLQPGGYVHLATDWKPYAEQMLAALSGEPTFVNLCESFAPRPDYRPPTKFEERGRRLGHAVWDLVFRRKSRSAISL